MMKETKARLIHGTLAAVTIALGVLVDQLTTSHAVWAPVVVALAVNLRSIISGTPPTVPPAAVAVVLALGLVVGACSHVTPVVKDCGAQAVLGIIDDVNTALATDDWRAGLAALVEKFGMCAVQKAVQEIAGQAEAKGRFDNLEELKAQRAKLWLGEQGVTISGFCPFGPCVTGA